MVNPVYVLNPRNYMLVDTRYLHRSKQDVYHRPSLVFSGMLQLRAWSSPSKCIHPASCVDRFYGYPEPYYIITNLDHSLIYYKGSYPLSNVYPTRPKSLYPFPDGTCLLSSNGFIALDVPRKLRPRKYM